MDFQTTKAKKTFFFFFFIDPALGAEIKINVKERWMMQTKEVCRQLQVTPKMLRVYEQHNLINPERKENNYREYSLDDIMQIKAIVTLKEIGFSLNQIRKILYLNEKEQDSSYSFYIQLKAVEARITELYRIRNVLKDSINEVLAEQNDILNIVFKRTCGIKESSSLSKDFIDKWNFDQMAIGYYEKYLEQDQGYKDGIIQMTKSIKNTGIKSSIIDIGCGTCTLWESFSDDYQLTALDNSYAMLAVAREKLKWPRFILGNILDEDILNIGTYDLIVSTFMLHHINYESQTRAINHLVKLMSQRGKMLIADRVFEDEKDKERYKRTLYQQNKFNRIENIDNEYHLYVKKVKPYIEHLGYKVNYSRGIRS